jgi:uncharacterized protein (DUF2126 family)
MKEEMKLYEMEIAFELKDKEVPFGWWIEFFRNLLTDITGNTHKRILYRQIILTRFLYRKIGYFRTGL